MSRSLHDTNYIFRDLYQLVTLLFIVLAALLLQFAQQDLSEAAEADMPGNLMATISWPEGNFDVDMWLDGPGEPVPVGYSNKGGLLWNLLRDDLGNFPDFTKFNFENAYTRGLPPGEYRINVQCYRCPQVPLEVSLEITKRGTAGMDGKAPVETIALSTITLFKDREEKTGLAFTVDADGNVVKESMTTLFKPLRSAKK